MGLLGITDRFALKLSPALGELCMVYILEKFDLFGFSKFDKERI